MRDSFESEFIQWMIKNNLLKVVKTRLGIINPRLFRCYKYMF
jgi:hypothetical protein